VLDDRDRPPRTGPERGAAAPASGTSGLRSLAGALLPFQSTLARSSSWALGGQVVSMLASMANFLLLARAVGPEGYGVIAGAWAVVLAAAPVASLGADRLIVRDATSSRASARSALGAGVVTVLAGSSVAFGVLALVHSAVLPQVPLALLLALAVADIMAGGIVVAMSSLCFATGDARRGSLVGITASIARLVAVLVFAVSGSDDPVRWAVLYASCSVVASLFVFVALVRRLGWPTLENYNLLRRGRDGLSYSGNSVATIVANDSDKTLLVRYGLTEEAGIYSVAYRLATISYLPALAVQQATFPRFFALGHQGGLPATVSFARRLVLPLAGYAVVAGVLLVAVAPLIPVLVGEEFRPSVPILMVLAGLPLVRSLHAVPGDALTGSGHQTSRTLCVGAAAAVSLALNLVLIPRLGVSGALVTAFVTEFLQIVLFRLAIRHHLRRRTDRAESRELVSEAEAPVEEPRTSAAESGPADVPARGGRPTGAD
jgi:O-antigen/teichoic acid export membrane protein